LRRKVKAVADESVGKDEAYATIVTAAGPQDVHIAHASGTAANPMSNEAIEAKFLANATPVITADRAARAVAYVWSLEQQTNVGALLDLIA
jgi:MmgE/PrpD C-terminal domain